VTMLPYLGCQASKEPRRRSHNGLVLTGP
jgi:hypothetical protein